MPNMQGAVALVTGAARQRGIGRAIALRLAQEGAAVAVSARPRDPASFPEHEQAIGWKGAASVAEEIIAAGGRAIAVDCDVTKSADVAAMVAAVEQALGPITALVNNAGFGSEAGSAPLVEMDDALWYRTIDVNLTGVYLVSKAVARAMIGHGQGGSMVNISSMAGRVGVANYGAYPASKFAVIGLTQQLALELAPHRIRVNCVCPGSVDTDMMDNTIAHTAERMGVRFDQVKSGIAKVNPMGRQGLPEEQAAATAFLLGPDAAFITGQSLNVNGGYRFD